MGLMVLADDLTGACESALAAVEVGGNAIATLGGAVGSEWDLVAVDLNARDRPGFVGPMRVSANREPLLKIDSTLRGPISALVERFAAATDAELLVVAPALPARGRVTYDGFQHVLGTDDPPVAVCRSIGSTPVETIVVDAEDDAGLDHAVALGDASGRRVGWVGSAGLVAALVRSRLGRRPVAAALDLEARPVLTVVGSETLESSVQAEALAARDDVEVARGADGIAAALGAGRHAVVRGGPPTALAAVVADVAGRVPVPRLLLTGGATARAVCDALGIGALEILGAAVDGAPLARVPGTDRLVVTKAGRFGPPDALSAAVDRLAG